MSADWAKIGEPTGYNPGERAREKLPKKKQHLGFPRDLPRWSWLTSQVGRDTVLSGSYGRGRPPYLSVIHKHFTLDLPRELGSQPGDHIRLSIAFHPSLGGHSYHCGHYVDELGGRDQSLTPGVGVYPEEVISEAISHF